MVKRIFSLVLMNLISSEDQPYTDSNTDSLQVATAGIMPILFDSAGNNYLHWFVQGCFKNMALQHVVIHDFNFFCGAQKGLNPEVQIVAIFTNIFNFCQTITLNPAQGSRQPD